MIRLVTEKSVMPEANPTFQIPQPLPPTQANPEELKVISNGPAILSNRVFSTLTSHGLRLTFCEQDIATGLPVFRAAVVLGVDDAIALGQLLTDQIEKYFGHAAVPQEVKTDG